MSKATQAELDFGDFGVTPEQACIMCHLSSECSGCCRDCFQKGNSHGCQGQMCSLPDRAHEGGRFRTWMYVVANFRPDLRRFVPRKYWKYINKAKLNNKTNKQAKNYETI